MKNETTMVDTGRMSRVTLNYKWFLLIEGGGVSENDTICRKPEGSRF